MPAVTPIKPGSTAAATIAVESRRIHFLLAW
jgi:hypothetical protein